MEYRFEIPGTLPTLNQYVDKERANRFAAAAVKKQAQGKSYLASMMMHRDSRDT